jgi:acylphosphatase
MSEKCLQLRITGLVQGVFFRKFTKLAAKDLRIKGWVRNDPDGSVYIEACGESEMLDEFIKWCHKGPDGSKVKNVESKEIPLKNFSTFDINYF